MHRYRIKNQYMDKLFQDIITAQPQVVGHSLLNYTIPECKSCNHQSAPFKI